MNGKNISRRNFFAIAWRSLLGLGGLIGLGALARYFSNPLLEPMPTSYDLGPIEALPRHPITVFPEAQAVLLNTADGFQALSLVCPHLGCLVNVSESGYTCPCHGSQFYLDGTLKKGPAAQSLKKLALSESQSGHLVIALKSADTP